MCFEACHLAWMLSRPNSCTQSYNQTPPYGHPLNWDTSFLRTVCFVPEKRKPLNIFSKFNPLNKDTPLLRTLSMPSSESVFTGFNRIRHLIDLYFIYPPRGKGLPLRLKLYRVYSIKRRPWLYTRLHAADGGKLPIYRRSIQSEECSVDYKKNRYSSTPYNRFE